MCCSWVRGQDGDDKAQEELQKNGIFTVGNGSAKIILDYNQEEGFRGSVVPGIIEVKHSTTGRVLKSWARPSKIHGSASKSVLAL